MEALIQVREVTRTFGAFVAADRVSFDVPRGKIFGFLGPNGSGKSTTIRMLAGLLAPTSGRITGFGGLDVATDTERWKHRMGYMSQKFSLYLDLTVEENLRFFGSIYGLSKAQLRERIAELSARLKFESLVGQMTRTLSTGQRQRVALAAALLHEPELLFLDEPTGGVDPRGRRIFWDLIYELTASRHMTVLVTTHYMDEAEQCDRLAFILNGKIIAEGESPALKQAIRGRIFEVDPRADPFDLLTAAQQNGAIEDAYLFGVRLRLVAAPDGIAETARLAETFGSTRMTEPTLEDVFVSLARRATAPTEKVTS
ncbi:MAG TPA: ABC transporter ATP-binding protein [Vicinamibacterales bacterium]|nr:ABC transporter ATP-binding protein [Vicinamibacterales bacterium]